MNAARIRRAVANDATAIGAIYAPIVRDTPISFEIDPPTVEEMARRIETIGSATPWLVCEEAGRLLGYAHAGSHRVRAAYRWSVDVSVYVAASQRGRGVAGALYAALLTTLEAQGFHRAYAGITLPNPESVALHERAGFSVLGVYREVGYKLGTWHDVGWWERALASPANPPAAPASLSSLSESGIAPAWQNAAARVRPS